ncbi:YHS domain-containing protein [Ktedonospora formicarum]|uniref:TRASH domain-containing protein n=1 Tax=Ktedonospora formicarum TaxID=2778364 RepID=A0A8J3I8K2_9CHLR|nr:YHS domain-containing protein [Ktedonospora formicarum]GHO48810.1 hypothetical protein KSX_69730 [Ktedonospora formicarum]
MANAIDPVCGMTVDTTSTTLTAEFQGETFYFCAPGCKKAFEKDPTSYLQQEPQESQEQASSCSCCHPQQV